MIIDYANLAGPFNTEVWVGAAPSDNGITPRRFFVGDISYFKIAIIEPATPDPGD